MSNRTEHAKQLLKTAIRLYAVAKASNAERTGSAMMAGIAQAAIAIDEYKASKTISLLSDRLGGYRFSRKQGKIIYFPKNPKAAA